MKILINGKFVDSTKAQVSVFDHGFLFGDGVYDTLRTFSGALYCPERHIQRLFQSMKEMYLTPRWSEEELLKCLQEGIDLNSFAETRIRIMVTRGENSFQVVNSQKSNLIIIFSELKELDSEYEVGVEVITCAAERALPAVKTISMAPVMKARGKMEAAGAFEVLLINQQGNVTEGSVTNLFVVKNGLVKTPGENILLGTTRELVLKWLDQSLQIGNLKLDDLMNADEVFVTNALKGVVPVVKIDGQLIGKGQVGDVTEALIKQWHKFLKQS